MLTECTCSNLSLVYNFPSTIYTTKKIAACTLTCVRSVRAHLASTTSVPAFWMEMHFKFRQEAL